MKALWTLAFVVLAAQVLIAQSSAIDSNFIRQFKKQESVSRAVTSTPPYEPSFYLVKFINRISEKDRKTLPIVRELSNHHAILISFPDLDRTVPLNEVEEWYDVNDMWKLPDGTNLNEAKKNITKWLVVPIESRAFFQLMFTVHAKILITDSIRNNILIELEKAGDIDLLLASPSVRFLQPFTPNPHEELLINGFDLSTNRANVAHNNHPGINGSGVVASVNENKFDSSDIDFKGRFISSGRSSSVITSHASIMATMMAGGGNSYYLGQGVAWNSNLLSVDFSTILPQANDFYQQFNVSVENHSFGTSIENFYGADAAAYDASVNSNASLVHVFSSGNSGTSSATSGQYAGITNFANLTGSFKMAKNIITVGATDSFNNVEVLSSRGPAFDGRIKPDLVAFGQDGSSGAAAIVSGTTLLMQQAYKNQHHDSLPPASLVRAALINSAEEVGNTGPDYISGFGALNVNRAVEAMINSRYFLNSIANNNSQTFSITVPPNTKQLKATLAYTDLPAQENTFKALVNDLDIEIKNVSTSEVWKPWVLSKAANKDSLLLPARRDRDSLNNVEQVSIDFPSAGEYEIKIIGYHVTNASQEFAVTYQIDTINRFEWNFPMRDDAVNANSQSALRWRQSFSGNGLLEYSLDRGNSWQPISAAVNLSQSYFKWSVPDTFSTAILRMTINGQQFTSDTFVVSRNIQMEVGFNCEDSVMLNWNSVRNADQYQVFALTSNFLQPLTKTNDTSFIFAKQNVTSKYFTVAPLVQNRQGIKAFTLNYETQGVECYIKNFLARLLNDKAIINFEIATLYQVRQIEIEKDNGNSFISAQTFDHPAQLSFLSQIGNLRQGINRFRIKITLQNGKTIYSEEELIYYTGSFNFIVYPNPVRVGQSLTVLRNNLDDATLVLYDSYGRRMQQVALQDIINPINTSFLQRGIYFMMIVDGNQKRIFQQKVIVQ